MEQRVISCEFVDNTELYAAYMPFLSSGGLFIMIRADFELGEELVLEVSLMGEPEAHEIAGKVVWITPVGAQGGKPAGIGVLFTGDNASALRNKIETYLAGMLHSATPTFTL